MGSDRAFLSDVEDIGIYNTVQKMGIASIKMKPEYLCLKPKFKST